MLPLSTTSTGGIIGTADGQNGNGSFDVQSIGSSETFLSCFTHPTGSMAEMLDQQQQNVYINPLDQLNRTPNRRLSNTLALDSRPSSSPGITSRQQPSSSLNERSVATLSTSSHHPDSQSYAGSGSYVDTSKGLRMRAYSKLLGSLRSR